MEVAFVPFDQRFLEESFVWLENEGLRRLIGAEPVSKESQELWFNSLLCKTDYFIWGVTANGEPVGVCGLKHVKDGSGEYWGYIGNSSFWGKGIGTVMVKHIEAFARSFGVNEIYLRVLRMNERAYSLYLRLDYQVYDQKNEMVFMKKRI